MKEAVAKLQGKGEDISSGIVVIQQGCTQLELLRADVMSIHTVSLSTVAGLLHILKLQQQCHASLIDRIISQHLSKSTTSKQLLYLFLFDAHTKQVASIQGFLPVRITSDFSLLDIQKAVD